jgi:HK97 family phage portal protein
MFPEIRDRVKAFMDRREKASRPLALEIKSGYDDLGSQEWLTRNGFYGLANQWGSSSPAWSGETVTLDTALNHSVVFTCKRIIAESVGFLPCPMMQKKGKDKDEASTHPMYNALQNAPNDEISAQRFRETITGHTVLGGNGYAQIMRRSGTKVANELITLLPAQVTPDREREGQRRLVYVVKEGNAQAKTYTVERGKAQDILHIPGIGWDGMRGYSILTLARHSVGTAIGAERHVGRFYARGGRLPYNLKVSQKWASDQDADKFRSDWNRIYANPSEAPILEPWLEYQQTGVNLADSQMLESRQFSVPEICRWFRISPHLAGDLSRATFANIEQLALEFVNFTLHVWLKRWEQELWRCVLTPEEKHQGYFWRHNVNALLRGDFKTRMEGYSIALQNGFMNQNEVRDLEDWNGFEGGDDYHIQLNMQQLPTAPGAPQTQANLVRLNNGSKQRRAA